MKRTEDLHGVLLGHITTIEATYGIARMAIELGVPGDFVECGVFAGAQSAAMARAIMDDYDGRHEGVEVPNRSGYPATRRVHLFDSFTGIPEAGPHDQDYSRGGHAAGTAACSLEQVKIYMERWKIPDELLVYHPGLFENTMRPNYQPMYPIRQAPLGHLAYGVIKSIAVLRLDGDLYESTKTCMQYLYPLVSPGGFVIVDDWNLDGCRKAIQEFVMPAPIMFRKDA